MSTATASSFLNAAGTMGRVTISERIEAARRQRRVLRGRRRPGRAGRGARRVRIEIPSARAETSAHVRSRSAKHPVQLRGSPAGRWHPER